MQNYSCCVVDTIAMVFDHEVEYLRVWQELLDFTVKEDRPAPTAANFAEHSNCDTEVMPINASYQCSRLDDAMRLLMPFLVLEAKVFHGLQVMDSPFLLKVKLAESRAQVLRPLDVLLGSEHLVMKQLQSPEPRTTCSRNRIVPVSANTKAKIEIR